MNKNYTPGPWHLKEKMSDYLVFPFQGDYPLAEVYTHRTSEGESNAQLIAAAPDLVEALIETLATLQNELDQSTDDNRKDYLVETIEKATAALTKAGVLTKDK